ncbi:MAG: rhodanese-like domain-containing protein [Halothece sp.]
MWKTFLTICLSFFLWIGGANYLIPNYSYSSNMALSATLSSEEIEEVVAQFLTNIPRGYYGVKEADEIERLVEKENAQLIDVREPLEYVRGHILNAINIPLRDLVKKQDKIAKDRPVILYCSVGYRTAIGLEALRLLGYDNVMGYPGSVEGWKATGKSLN